MRDRQFGNCPKVEMNGSKMLQDSDRSRRLYSDPSKPPNPLRLRLESGEETILKIELEPNTHRE